MHPPPDPDYLLRNIESYKSDGAEPQLGSAVAGGVNRLVRMDVYVDSQYNDYYGGDGLLKAMSALNIADGIYRQNFGLALEIGNATVFTNRNSDPMNLGAVTLEATLRKFRDLRLATDTSSDDIALTYLFSGNNNIDEAIGLAWIGAVCRNDGFDVGVTTPSTYADMLVTHELGHSLGALHDTDTSCSNEHNKLMWPRISGTTNQSFSACSRNTVSAGVAKSCILSTIDLSLDVQPLGSSGVAVVVSNNDARSTAHNASVVLETTAVDLDLLPPSCVEGTVGELLCQLERVGPGDSTRIEFTLAAANAQGSLTARVTAGNLYDVVAENNQAQVSLDLQNGGLTEWQGTTAQQAASVQSDVGLISADSDASGSGTSGGGGSSDWWLILSTLVSGLLFRAHTSG